MRIRVVFKAGVVRFMWLGGHLCIRRSAHPHRLLRLKERPALKLTKWIWYIWRINIQSPLYLACAGIVREESTIWAPTTEPAPPTYFMQNQHVVEQAAFDHIAETYVNARTGVPPVRGRRCEEAMCAGEKKKVSSTCPATAISARWATCIRTHKVNRVD